MKRFFRNFLVLVIAVTLFTACSNLTKEVENKLNELNDKALSMDSLLNKEVERVLSLDSLISSESDKVKKLDSLINNTSSKLDSIANEKVKRFEKIVK